MHRVLFHSFLNEVVEEELSDKMFDRILNLVALREFNSAIARMNEQDKKNLELEYENLTGMECDDAARIQTDEQFVETMRRAYENLKRRKPENKSKVVEIYA